MRWWLILCLCANVQTIFAHYYEIQCTEPLCVTNDIYQGIGNFTVEGHNILFGYKYIQDFGTNYFLFSLDCGGWTALESTAMPRFVTQYQTSFIELNNCPLPNSASIASVLTAFNVILAPSNSELDLMLKNVPSEPKLTSAHFRGLDSLTSLSIFAVHSVQQLEPAAGFLSNLPKLRSLLLSAVKLPPNELYNLPNTLDWFKRTDQNLAALHNIVSDTVLILPGLRVLKLEQNHYSADIQSYKLKEEHQDDRKNLKNQATLETLEVLSVWKERRLAPFQRCNDLRSITFKELSVEELPDRWVAACPRLENLIIYNAQKINRIPEKLLEGATSLKTFNIMRTNVEYLPDGFLKDAHNLEDMKFTSSKLHTISSGVFRGAASSLQELSLVHNSLDNSALAAVSELKSLQSLELTGNQLDGDLCDDDDYAPVRSLPKLQVLRLPNSVIVCSYWRSHFHALTDLFPRPSWKG